MTVSTGAYETVIDCIYCRHSFDAVLDMGEVNKLKCPKCHGLLGVNADADIEVWDRSADQEG